MQRYDQAMKSLRLSDPVFHQKLTDTLYQIIELPQETAQQLADSLDDISDTNTYREKLMSGLNDIRKAGEESWEAFEKEHSWLGQQFHNFEDVLKHNLYNTGDTAARTLHDFHTFMNQHGRLFSNLAMFNFLAACFCSVIYFFYIHDSSNRPSMITSISKVVAICVVAVAVLVTMLGASEDIIRVAIPAMAVGALLGRLSSFLPCFRPKSGTVGVLETSQTWLDTIICTFGFLLSSGFFAAGVLLMQDRSKTAADS